MVLLTCFSSLNNQRPKSKCPDLVELLHGVADVGHRVVGALVVQPVGVVGTSLLGMEREVRNGIDRLTNDFDSVVNNDDNDKPDFSRTLILPWLPPKPR